MRAYPIETPIAGPRRPRGRPRKYANAALAAEANRTKQREQRNRQATQFELSSRAEPSRTILSGILCLFCAMLLRHKRLILKYDQIDMRISLLDSENSHQIRGIFN
jgi:hypothetical protein